MISGGRRLLFGTIIFDTAGDNGSRNNDHCQQQNEKALHSTKILSCQSAAAHYFCNVIAIGNALVSDELITEKFVCDLNKCKGACCVDGDAGAPLQKAELKNIDEVYETVKPYMPVAGVKEVEKQGRYVYDRSFGWVTPTIEGGICVYAFRDAKGIVKCGIEQAYLDGKIQWKKPVSCHLFPVVVKQSRDKRTDYVNYQPREDHCSPACAFGKKLRVPVYKFLREPLVRRFGNDFYDALEATAEHLKTESKTK